MVLPEERTAQYWDGHAGCALEGPRDLPFRVTALAVADAPEPLTSPRRPLSPPARSASPR